MEKIYNKKSKEDKEKEVNELFKKANEGIENCFSSIEQLKELADYMSKFYNYSLRNTFLIQEQFEGAFAVGSYSFWKDKGFSVNKGEKGIKILVPNKLSDYFINSKGEETKLSKATTEEKKLIEEGKIELKKGNIIFNQGYVFDVSQTNAKAEDLPKIFPGRWLDGEVKNYDLMYKAMENIAKKIEVKIIEPKSELGAAKGAAYPLTKEVALNPRNTELQNVKTLIHELAHAKLHTIEKIDNYTTNEREFQAEMTAYVVSSYFGIDTSEYSFRYISSWSKDTELKEKLINEVKETVKEYVEIIENTLINDKELSLSLDNISIDTEITNNREKEQFLNLNKEELAKIYERQMTEEEKVFIEKQGLKLSDVVENFKEVLEEFDIEKFSFKDYLIETMGTYNELFNTSKEITIDNISIDTKITNNREKEEFLNLNKEDLIKVYEKELSETTKSLIRECELNLSSLVNTFKDTLDDYFVKEDNSIGISFEYFLNYEIFGYTLTEEEQIKNENRVKGNENMKIGLTQKEVNKMVKDHEEWINTKGKKGKRLDLEGKELNGIRLLNVNLKEANLKNMTIKDSTIFANLDGADFEGTKIENSKFIGSKIENLKIDAKELERINIQIKEELSLHNEAESTLKTNKNKRKTKEKNNENEIQI